ncbi:MAG: tetratricopeptide repeat protein [Alphaproteobacteria bacterium]|nr:tetratricopeptide repeat protein [Alphaproteobacteria bacterium]
MRADEEQTFTDLQGHLSELVGPVVGRFHGRIVKTIGDGLFVEFGSAVEALRAAIDLQRGMAERNAGVPDDRRQTFRIGLHLGDVILSEADLFGDTVNVAARLQAMAEPGAIVLSSSVHEQVRDKLSLPFRDLGRRNLKNIDRPVHAWSLDPANRSGAPLRASARRERRHWHRRSIAVGVVAALAIILAAAAYLLAPGYGLKTREGAALRASTTGNPSVAVLPFASQSAASQAADSGPDYFSNGLTEDITAALGRFKQLTVIAHAAVLPYRGKPVPIAQLGRDLNARYLVSGSVRRMDPRVRVAVQLTDATNGTQLWADQYDDQLTDIFEVQQRIAQRVAGTLATSLQQIALQQSLRKPTANLDAYDLLLRARSMAAGATRAGNREAREALERVTEMSPNYADAHAELADAYLQRVAFGWSEFADQDVERAIREAQKAAEIDGESVLAHSVLARAYTAQQKYDLGLAEADRALQLNASDTDALAARAEVLLWTGHIDQSIEAAEFALRLNDKVGPEVALNLGLAYLLARRYPDAIRLLETARARYPAYPLLDFPLAGAYAESGRAADATNALDQGRRKDPYLTLDSFGTRFQDGALKKQVADSLRKAGFK